MSGTLTVAGLVANLPSGEKVIGPVTMLGTATIGQITDVVLSAGDTTIGVPSAAAAVVLVVAASNTSVLRLRTSLNASDVGVPFGPSGFVVLPIAAGVTSLIVNSPGSISLEASFI